MLGRRLVLGWGVLMGLSACAPHAGGTFSGSGTSPEGKTRGVQAVLMVSPFNMSKHRRPGCYSHGGKQLKFRILRLDTDDARTWQATAGAISTDCDWSALWDSTWYYQSMPSDQARTLLIAWKNVTTGDSDFLAIKYAPPHFVVAGKDGELAQLNDGGRKVFRFKTGGTGVNVDVENVPDDAVWKTNEFKWRILH